MTRTILLTGTPIVEPPVRVLQAGPLEATFDAGSLRWVRWRGVEILRAILFLVRTPGWGTPAPHIDRLEVDEDGTAFRIAYRARYGDTGAGLAATILLTGDEGGRLEARAEIDAEIPFETNRTGFVILHPLDGFAGTKVHVDHASGPARDLVIPAQISPGQPVMDIRAITHWPVPGLLVETRFAGDVFEMEDHRNWSDASFKTYSRPIGLPYPYRLLPGQSETQSVSVTIHEEAARAGQGASTATEAPPIADQTLPAFALPLDRLADAAALLGHPGEIRALAPRRLLLRLDSTSEPQGTSLGPLKRLLILTGATLEVQAVLASTTDAEAEAEIADLAHRLADEGITVDAISAFAKVDEQSFQPGEMRPPHPAEPVMSASLARHFPSAVRIGGTPAFFTEFNRKRPDPSLWDGLTFATTPLVHAADDRSVVETLQSLPHILGSATALAQGLPLLVGPVGIGARLNPYSAGPTDNDPEAREGMAARDPRQRGLFAAAWIIGYLVRIAPFAPARFAFGAATGPFGLISTRQDYPRRLWDALADGSVYPLFHIARILAAAAGADLLEAETEGDVARLVWRQGDSRRALIANLSLAVRPMPEVQLHQPLLALLDAGNVATLASDPDGLVPTPGPLPQQLDGYAVLYLFKGEAA